jgi:hypothetical protein
VVPHLSGLWSLRPVAFRPWISSGLALSRSSLVGLTLIYVKIMQKQMFG